MGHTHRPQSHGLGANVDQAEEQPVKIAAIQKKEPQQKKKFAEKKIGGWPSAAPGGQAKVASGSGSGSGSDSGGLPHSEQARVGSGLCYFHWTHGARGQQVCGPLLMGGKLKTLGRSAGGRGRCS